jgi:hypothetical protein
MSFISIQESRGSGGVENNLPYLYYLTHFIPTACYNNSVSIPKMACIAACIENNKEEKCS